MEQGKSMQNTVAMRAGNYLLRTRHYTRTKAFKMAWAIIKAIKEDADPLTTVMIDDLKCCSNCLSGSWLIDSPTYGNNIITCLSCGEKYTAL